MLKKRKGIAPIIIAIIAAVGLLGGATAGYEFREPIKKAVSGQNTLEEIQHAVNKKVSEIALGKSKFQLEGVVTSVTIVTSPATTTPATTTQSTTTPIATETTTESETTDSATTDTTNSTDTSTTRTTTTATSTTVAAEQAITVKIKSSTNSIKEMRLSETPIIVNSSTKYQSGSKASATLADVLIGSKVHIGGKISNGKLVATKVIVQKEESESDAQKVKNFSINGSVKTIAVDKLVVTVTAANKKAKEQISKDLTIKVSSITVVKKGETTITLADVKVGDLVKIEGVVEKDSYAASSIEVKVVEEAAELDDSGTAVETKSNKEKNEKATNAQNQIKSNTSNKKK